MQYAEHDSLDRGRLEWPLPGDANLKKQGDPLRLEMWLSSVNAQMQRLRREFSGRDVVRS